MNHGCQNWKDQTFVPATLGCYGNKVVYTSEDDY